MQNNSTESGYHRIPLCAPRRVSLVTKLLTAPGITLEWRDTARVSYLGSSFKLRLKTKKVLNQQVLNQNF